MSVIEIPLITLSSEILIGWFWGLSFFIFIISLALLPHFGWILPITFGYLSVNALWYALHPYSRYANEPFIYVPIAYLSITFVFCLMAAVFFARFFELQSLAGWFLDWWIGISAVLNSLYVIYGRITGTGMLPEGVGYSGWLNYAGMNGSLIAVSMPFIRQDKFKWVAYALCIYAIILSKSSIPYGVLAVIVFSYLLTRKLPMFVVTLLTLTPVLIGGLLDFNGIPGLLDSGYRFKAYSTFMHAWWHNASHAFGTGMGSFHVVSKYIQEASGFMKEKHWGNMHSDWLQMLFDGGYIAIFLVATLCASIAIKLYRHSNPKYFCTFMGLVACAIFDFPFRYFGFCLIGIIAAIPAYGGSECQRIK